jgi:hypothetical protein
MALESVIAYVVVLGLPVWLVAEEIIRRIASRRPAPAPTAAPVGLERRAPEGAPAHAHVQIS